MGGMYGEHGGPGNGEHACSIYSIQAKNIFPEKGGFECNGGAKREGNKWHFVQRHYICVERTCACIAMVTVVWQQILILHAILQARRTRSKVGTASDGRGNLPGEGAGGGHTSRPARANDFFALEKLRKLRKNKRRSRGL